MSEAPSLVRTDGKVFNVHAAEADGIYGPLLPNYLRRSVAMACGPPGNLPLHLKASQTIPTLSTPSKSERSLSRRERTIKREPLERSADLKRRIKYSVLCDFLDTLKSVTLNELSISESEEKEDVSEEEQEAEEVNKEEDKVEMATATKTVTESVQVEEAEIAQEQIAPCQKAADMLSKAILHHEPISINDFAFLIDQIDAYINLDEHSVLEMLDLLIEKKGISPAYSGRAKRCLQRELKKKGGQLTFGTFRNIIAYFRKLSKA